MGLTFEIRVTSYILYRKHILNVIHKTTLDQPSYMEANWFGILNLVCVFEHKMHIMYIYNPFSCIPYAWLYYSNMVIRCVILVK